MSAADDDLQALTCYFDCLKRMSLLLCDMHGFHHKPIFSPAFGYGRYSLGSRWSIQDGLDVVSYYVIDTKTRFVVSEGPTKAAALDLGRRTVKNCASILARYIEAFPDELNAAREQRWEQERQERDSRRAEAPAKVQRIGRRRKQIFDESEGKCHYCSTTLTLDGKWHIEHKHPKALGGGNEPGNLVASCVPCNMKKRDTTDIEFKARLAKEQTA